MKTYTAGAKRRAKKGGRPRKEGRRQPDGRLAPAAPAERAEDAKRPTLVVRCRLMGWPVTADNLKRADAAHMGALHGRMWEAGALTEAQWRALDSLLIARWRWLRSIGAPPESAQGAALAYVADRIEAEPDHAPALPEDPGERARRLANAWMAAEQAGGMACWRGWRVAMAVIAGEPPRSVDELHDLRRCADGLARHFGWA